MRTVQSVVFAMIIKTDIDSD